VTDAGAATLDRRAAPIVRRVVTAILDVVALWGLWEGYKWLWASAGWTWPFAVNDTTKPQTVKLTPGGK
jgi:hypothetical protein